MPSRLSPTMHTYQLLENPVSRSIRQAAWQRRPRGCWVESGRAKTFNICNIEVRWLKQRSLNSGEKAVGRTYRTVTTHHFRQLHSITILDGSSAEGLHSPPQEYLQKSVSIGRIARKGSTWIAERGSIRSWARNQMNE